MTLSHRARLQLTQTFPQLIRFLRDEMGWPIESEDFEDLTFIYTPEELGIESGSAAKIAEIQRLRPLVLDQPWGIFFVRFEPKRLPVVALRRILSAFVMHRRVSADSADRMTWETDDLLFISNYGEDEDRQLSFAHFSPSAEGSGLPTLKVLGWDNRDTALHLDRVAKELTEKLAWPHDETDLAGWRETWSSAFTLGHREVVTTSKALAVRLAALARVIRDRIKTVLAIENENGPVTKLMTAFRETLVHDLDPDDFADMYAQTIAYGLLSARIADPKSKTTDDLGAHMRTNPLLRELMTTFVDAGAKGNRSQGEGVDFDELGVSEVVELLDDANMEAVVRDFGDRNPEEDPVIHFYELFLKEYDPKEKLKRGVFYTPRPVVSYIVRSVDELLRNQFGLADGLADTSTWGEMAMRNTDLRIPDQVQPSDAFVQILDPATGTGTFLVEAIDLIHGTLVTKWKARGHDEKRIEALWNDYVPTHLLPRLHGYELLMAPYAIAHLKIGLKLYETGYRFGSDERARVYLTNALEPAHEFSGRFEFAIPALAHEALAVNEIKGKQRFTVVIGNPPYNNRSENSGAWIMAQIELYKTTVRREETQIQALSDDYIKFLRIADLSVCRSGLGVIGMITNNGFLDGHLFRDLRSYLSDTYEVISITNLHGDTRKKERTPEGDPDKNVFDIMQGVSVTVLGKVPKPIWPDILYADIWGERAMKYSALSSSESVREARRPVSREAAPDMLIPAQPTEELWRDALRLEECFGTGNWQADKTNAYGSGFKSRQDQLAIAFSVEDLVANIELLLRPEMTRHDLMTHFSLCTTKHWDFDRARRRLPQRAWRGHVRRVLFRPFDFRFTLLHPDVVAEYRPEIMQQLEKPNVALLATRKATEGFAVFVTNVPCGHKIVGNYDMTTVFPLYRYPAQQLEELELGQAGRVVNLSRVLLQRLEENLRLGLTPSRGVSFTPEAVLHYAYALFHSPTYRTRFGEALKNGYPRLPLPHNRELVCTLAGLGGELVDLHLMESPKLAQPVGYYFGPMTPLVAHAGWSDDTVWLDAAATKKGRSAKSGTVGFRHVPEAVWNFRIGSYQVCEKWLKDRKGRTLSTDDIAHYQKIVVALSETMRLMQEIDEVIEEYGGWPGAFQQESPQVTSHEARDNRSTPSRP